ncbi:MAG: hypothetical protein JW966_10665 [Anaerolineae bacterium]|nr:hypothetical protein [Anaerolineae bacterium]
MPQQSRAKRNCLADLRTYLITMGDALLEVSPDGLRRHGRWDQALFEVVLNRVESQTPGFQHVLVDFLALPERGQPDVIAALLAVDRLSAAYTYWTRLFPPRQADESMFVLSLLHDLSDKVEHAINLLDELGGQS